MHMFDHLLCYPFVQGIEGLRAMEPMLTERALNTLTQEWLVIMCKPSPPLDLLGLSVHCASDIQSSRSARASTGDKEQFATDGEFNKFLLALTRDGTEETPSISYPAPFRLLLDAILAMDFSSPAADVVNTSDSLPVCPPPTTPFHGITDLERLRASVAQSSVGPHQRTRPRLRA